RRRGGRRGAHRLPPSRLQTADRPAQSRPHASRPPCARSTARARKSKPRRGDFASRVPIPARTRIRRHDSMADQTLTLTLDTGNGEGGDVVIKLRPDLAPGHVERITELAKEGFYDGVVFHRVIPGFMAQ